MNGLDPVSLKENNLSHKVSVKYDVQQFQFLGHLLFLIHISDPNQNPINFCKVHHFADDKNLVEFSNSVKNIMKYINIDMKNLTNRQNANKISLNLKKLN